jgi:hypothetical protein
MYEVGDRVELVYTSDEYTDLEPGDTGTVTATTMVSVPGPGESPVRKPKTWVDWDDGGSLAMIGGEDKITKVDDAE